MNSQEFVLWLKGFTEGVHEYNITPKQWDLLKEKLNQVSDEPKTVYPLGVPNLNPNGTTSYDPSTLPNTTYPWGAPIVWAGTPEQYLRTTTSGYIAPVGQRIPPSTITSGSSSTALFTFPGTTVSYTVTTGSGIGVGSAITTTNDPFNGTATVFNPQSGSWHYTTSNDKTLLND